MTLELERAAAELTIQDLVWQLPKCHTDTLCEQKSAAEYSVPVLGLIFLRYADHRFAAADAAIQAKWAAAAETSGRQRPVSPSTTRPRRSTSIPA